MNGIALAKADVTPPSGPALTDVAVLSRLGRLRVTFGAQVLVDIPHTGVTGGANRWYVATDEGLYVVTRESGCQTCGGGRRR